ncbi:MAG: SRPBCC family protein [Acidimicrobiales bacterium]
MADQLDLPSPGEARIVSASRQVLATPERIFALIADPTRQPEWDANDNLASAVPSQRVRSVGDVFAMTLTRGAVRENHVVEFVEGRRIAWKPAEPGRPAVGHLWRWELEAIDDERSLVVHTYDWTELHDEARHERARATTSERLVASIERLAALVER